MDAAVSARTDDHWVRRHPWLVITAVCAILFVPTDLVLGYARIPANHRLFHPYYHHDLASRASFEETWRARFARRYVEARRDGFFANRRQERARWTFDDAVFENGGAVVFKSRPATWRRSPRSARVTA